MKKRLCGLTALLLCAVLVCAPVMAMAYTYFEDSAGNWESVSRGSLIYTDEDIRLVTYRASGMTAKKIIYNDGVTADFTSGSEINGLPSWVHNLRTLPGNEAWLVTKTEEDGNNDEILFVTRVKRIFHQPITVGEQSYVVQGFDQLDPFFSGIVSDYQIPPEELYGQGLSGVKNELKNAIMNRKPDCGGQIAYYDYSVYKPSATVSRAYDYVDLSRSPKQEMTITLPYPDGYSMANAAPEDFCIAHMYVEFYGDDDIGVNVRPKTETFTGDQLTLTPDGIRITVTSLSPFALGCKAPVPVSESSSIPQTGDSFPLAFVLGMLLLSGAGLMAVRRRKAA